MTNTLEVNKDRIWQRVMELAEHTEVDKPYTRRAFTDMYLQGREQLKKYFADAGLDSHLSVAANIIGTRKGQNDSLAPIALGSHIDTVVEGGRFDGIAGVIVALEVAQVIYEQDIDLNHPLTIIDFLSEEPSDYGLSCIGSRAHGTRFSKDFLQMQNLEGETLGEAMTRMGADVSKVLDIEPVNYKAFLELHIEQAKRLESTSTKIGIVSGFAGIWRYKYTIEGQADHAGTTPMDDRQDALMAATKLMTLVQETAANDKSDLVATVGQVELRPNAVNAVPGLVQFTVEIRCLDATKHSMIIETLDAEVERLLNSKEVNSIEREMISDVSPAPCDANLQNVLARACDANDFSHMPLTSGAGHDAYHMLHVAPSAMIFIPSKDGRSHTSEEYSSPESLAQGAQVLLDAVIELDKNL